MAGLEPVYAVDSVAIHTVKTHPLGLVIGVQGKTATPGWSDFELKPVVYVTYPEDGVQDIYWNGQPPSGVSSQAITEVDFGHTWIGFPEGQLKGVRIHTASNSLEAFLDPLAG